ncbi:MAG: SPOR domain-containing protein [Chloracidobacterium sp.]|nr:SPOR domain-containing protein [Chloracidobacterium sp.]
MKVTCPKCQFENQADSSRVVCARCATIIEVRMDQGFDSNGKRQTARLPFTSGGLTGGQSLGSQRFNQSDVYATRIGDDFDDVLDVPIQSQSGYQPVEDPPSAPVFEDVFTTGQNQDQPSPYDFAAYSKPSAPLDGFASQSARPRDPQDYIEPVEQDFVGWPVLPEGAEEEEEVRSGRGGLFLRLGLIFGLLGVVSFWAYYFLGDLLAAKRRGGQSRPQPAAIVENKGGVPNQPPPPEPQVTRETSVSKAPGGAEAPDTAPTTVKGQRGDLVPQEKSGALKKTSSPNPPPSTRRLELSSKGGNLTIQVGSFKDQGEAEAKASGLNAAIGGDFHVVKAEIPGMGVWYRVQQGNGFASREEALSYGNRLRARNLISAFIVTSR